MHEVRESRGPPPGRRKRGRGGQKGIHYAILLIFVLAAGVTLSLTVFFKIESIEVTGADRYDPDAIIAASGIEPGENLLRLPTGRIEERILEAFPYIASVRVERRFPPKVELLVTQSVPEGAVINGGEVALITLDGKLLERGDLLVPPELPVFRGISLMGYEPGEMIGGADDPENEERLIMLRYLFMAAEKTGFEKITNVDVEDRLNMKMVYEARLILELGSEADMEYKLTFLSEVIADLGPDDQARLDASNAKDKRVLVKWGRVENGAFYAQNQTIADKAVYEAENEEYEPDG